MTMTFAAPRSNAVAEPMLEMNMTPLIDVMLVLIIMLIITIPRQQHTINLSLPSHGVPNELPPIAMIDIDFDGTILWDGIVVPTRMALESKLVAAAASIKPIGVQLRPNKLVPYKSVAAVMALAQRSHVLNLALIGNEQFM